MKFLVGYTKNDVLYRWNAARQVAIAPDMKLSQFDLIGTPAGNQTYLISSKNKEVAQKQTQFSHLNSHLGKLIPLSFFVHKFKSELK